jgi:CxxC motif-containing protein (DUF1111 family)
MRRVTILGLIAASSVGTVVLVANAQQASGRADFWPRIKGSPVVHEWYSDIPWHQKLGTQGGNEIDQALVLPVGALPDKEQKYCKDNKISDADCMLEFGVVNVLGMLRTDTPYDTTDTKIQAAPECKDPSMPCIEVALELSSFWSRLGSKGVELQKQKFGTEPPTQDNLKPSGAFVYGGYVITDGSTYAPQMPWYMTHSCQAGFTNPNIDMQDPVCYADYFSPMNDGFNLLTPQDKLDQWPRTVPWSVFPYNNPQQNHCAGGTDTCTMVMATFDLQPLDPDPAKFQYKLYNDNLLTWFNNSLKKFKDEAGPLEFQRRFPWSGEPVTWSEFVYPQAKLSPFLGRFDAIKTADAVTGKDCNNVSPSGPPTSLPCSQTDQYRAKTYLYPRQCDLGDLAGGDVDRLRKCGVNYELHHNGFLEQLQKSYWQDYADAGMRGNQYGRTSFLFAGVPGMQLPVSFQKVGDSGLTIYEQVHNSSIFSLYLPIANVADSKGGFPGRPYTDTPFYHTLLMSNHMEAEPELFAQGIRGKVLWHNEYRTEKMYLAYANAIRDHKPPPKFAPVTFAGSFDADKAPAPFHNNTCDACHVRNGSGIPINGKKQLDPLIQQQYMTTGAYNARFTDDYTFTGTIRPMKLVFFDLKRDTSRERLDASRYSEPLAFPAAVVQKPLRNYQPDDLYYNSKIMNYYGDAFHFKEGVTEYDWAFRKADANRMVVPDARVNRELGRTYEPWQIQVSGFTVNGPCQIAQPAAPTTKPWPESCKDVDATAVRNAVNGDGTKLGDVGVMFLNGKRLGNLGTIEAIPNQTIIDIRDAQKASLGDAIAGELIWQAGTRDGAGGTVKKDCKKGSLVDCYIGRFGWIGDRASLEDQVANAAFVEMNMTTNEGYKQIYGNDKVMFPLRYPYPNCGPANKKCLDSGGNGKLTETDVNRMADYARWVGSPTRSDLQVAMDEVVQGEKVFKRVKCDTCHVIAKISIAVTDDTMVTEPYRKRLATRISHIRANMPFLSYIGTDLLMHDMGYLSQVGDAGQSIRDAEGVVKPEYRNYVQKIRTPALKGLQYNRYVTESYKNTKNADPQLPACDFLLHDGRACDAIEAAFLHDGPAVKKLGMIDGLNKLSESELKQLRAFLYSL